MTRPDYGDTTHIGCRISRSKSSFDQETLSFLASFCSAKRWYLTSWVEKTSMVSFSAVFKASQKFMSNTVNLVKISGTRENPRH